jgi:hypothetical protein
VTGTDLAEPEWDRAPAGAAWYVTGEPVSVPHGDLAGTDLDKARHE